jgi:hypothetical protein
MMPNTVLEFYYKNNREISLVRNFINVLLICSAIIQLFLFFTYEDNAVSVLIVLFVSLLTTAYCLNARVFCKTPVSSLLILGFNFVSLSGALVVMTMGASPIVKYLNVPLYTFGLLAIAQITLVFSHVVYLRSYVFIRISEVLRESILKPIGLFDLPSDKILWTMGLVGCVAISLTRAGSFSEAQTFQGNDVGIKVFAGFAVFSSAPLFGPIFQKFYERSDAKLVTVSWWPLVIYFLMLLMVATVANTRQVFADAVIECALGAVILFCLGKIKLTSELLKKLLLVALVAIVVLPLMSRFSIAMVVAREFRADSSPISLLSLTWSSFWDQSAISSYQESIKTALLGDYNEFYAENPLLSRFIITKFHDNMFYFSGSLQAGDGWLLFNSALDRIIALLPQPLINTLGFHVDKADLLSSNGDYLFSLASGYGLGGYRTGSMIAEGFAMLGIFYPLLLGALAIVCFAFYDAFVDNSRPREVVVAPVMMFQIWYLFGGVGGAAFGAEGLSNVVVGLLRGMPQMVVFYCVIAFFVNSFLSTRPGSK